MRGIVLAILLRLICVIVVLEGVQLEQDDAHRHERTQEAIVQKVDLELERCSHGDCAEVNVQEQTFDSNIHKVQSQDSRIPPVVVKDIPTKFSPEEEEMLLERYGAIFEKQSTIDRWIKLEMAETSSAGDGDSCCPTENHFWKNETLRDIKGDDRAIVHLTSADPPMYQILPVGMCVAGGRCTGSCIQETKIHFALVWDPLSKNHPPVAFLKFRIPSYCSCKNPGVPINIRREELMKDEF